MKRISYDDYFFKIADAAASRSACLSRKLGAVIVKDNSIISTGYNGPSRGIPHCDERQGPDGNDNYLIAAFLKEGKECDPNICPRYSLGYKSGQGLHLCPATHAEINAIADAARRGVSVLGSTLYLNWVIPCSNCLKAIINAGIVEVVVRTLSTYDPMSEFLIRNSNLKIRVFNPMEE